MSAAADIRGMLQDKVDNEVITNGVACEMYIEIADSLGWFVDQDEEYTYWGL